MTDIFNHRTFYFMLRARNFLQAGDPTWGRTVRLAAATLTVPWGSLPRA